MPTAERSTSCELPYEAISSRLGRGGGLDGRLHRRIRDDPERDRPARRLERVDGDAAEKRPGTGGPLALLGSACDRVSDRERSHRSRALLSARESEHTGSEGELPPLIVMSHGGPTSSASPRLQPGHAVLDEPRFRRRRRQLRRIDGLRTRLPRTTERPVGSRRPAGLRECRTVPRRRGRGRSRPAADHRWKRRWVHDDLRADVHRRVRGRERRTSASPTSSSSAVATPTSSSSSTSTRSSAPIRRLPSSTVREARSTSSTRSRRPCWCCREPTTRSCRPRRPS